MHNKLKDILKNKLSIEQLKLVPSSYDVIGRIIIFSDFPRKLYSKEKIIGQELLKNHKNINSIFKKIKKHSGKFRTRKLKLIAGENNNETIHHENKIKVKLNAEKVYFSPRLSEERKRIYEQVKKGEKILVLFSGCGVYPLIIAKNTDAKEIIGIEINPTAHKYALLNLELNKIKNTIKFILGDVKKILPKISRKFDRIIMPLPKGAENFLALALTKIKKNGFIHFYSFSVQNKHDKIIEIIKVQCKRMKKKCRIINVIKCGQFSPRVNRICVEFKIG